MYYFFVSWDNGAYALSHDVEGLTNLIEQYGNPNLIELRKSPDNFPRGGATITTYLETT